jgi:hypothetical protein
MEAGTLGFIDTPAQGNKRPEGVTWCADNGCFSDKWDVDKWWKFLEDNAHDAATCLFAVAPDVVGDALATTIRSRPWLPKIRALGYPVAYVAQNGIEKLRGNTVGGGLTFPVPWDSFDVLFIGGTVECVDHGPRLEAKKTGRGAHLKFWCDECGVRIYEWKLGNAARSLVHEAKRRGKWVHAGRVNSGKRFEYFRAIGADSADGTYLTAGPDKNLPKLLAWTRNNDQPGLFGGVVA